jgi:excisionase family DNA binding protein
MIIEEELLTVREVAKLFRVTEQTVYAWVKSGKLPKPVRLGKRCLWGPRALGRVVRGKGGDE